MPNNDVIPATPLRRGNGMPGGSVTGAFSVSEALVAAHSPFSAQVEALRALRSQLMARWFDGDPAHKMLAVVSAQRNEGRSFIAANLAIVFSQLGQRTLLIDADLRNPNQHRLFKVDNSIGLSEILAEHSEIALSGALKPIAALENLSVLPAGLAPPNPADLLARSAFAQLLHDLLAHFDIIIADTPAAAGFAEAQSIAAHAGAALIVAQKNRSRIAQVRALADGMAHTRATVVGTVLNDA